MEENLETWLCSARRVLLVPLTAKILQTVEKYHRTVLADEVKQLTEFSHSLSLVLFMLIVNYK